MDKHDLLLRYRKTWSRKAPVTIIVANFNYQDYIKTALQSLVAQTHKKLNLVIVDDHSSDNSCEVITTFLTKHKKRFQRAYLVRTCENVGPPRARNIGIRFIPSRYYFFLDSDNFIYPRCIERHFNALEHSSAQFAYAISAKFGDREECLSAHPWDEERLRKGNYIDMISMIRGDWLKAIGLFSLNSAANLGWEDYDIWIKTALNNGFGIHIPQILSKYRVHQLSRSNLVSRPNIEYMREILQNEYPQFYEKK